MSTNSSDHLLTLAVASASVNNILGLPLNVYVMWLILTGARETLASDFFALNLAISESSFAFSCIFYLVYIRLKLFYSLEAFMFSRGLLFTARPLFLCCICIEYYLGVVHPVLFLRFKPLRYKVACCCVVWPLTLVFCFYSLYTFSKPLYLYGFFITTILFLSVILFCCLSVLRALKRPGPGDTEKKKSNAMKKRAFKIILLIMISLAMNCILYLVTIPLQCCLTEKEFMDAFIICTSLALTTAFIQPVLYLHRSGKLPCFKKL